jgi:hypothetical protein
MNGEIWKDIPNYEELYQVSDLGNVRSLDRFVHHSDGNTRFQSGRVLKPFDRAGYQSCALCINAIRRAYPVHQLVAMAFLNHKPNGHTLVVDHINGKKDDNRLENLQIITNRHNLSKDPRGTSMHTGVSWDSKTKKWIAKVFLNGRQINLGRFTDESEAALTYQNALKEHLTSKNT